MEDGNAPVQLKRMVSALRDENEALRRGRDREPERSAKLTDDLVTCHCEIRR